MRNMQYIIVNLDNNLQIQWEGNVILFDTQEEAEEMIESFKYFLKEAKLQIKKGIYFIDNSINYKDLKLKEDYIKELGDSNE